MRRLLLICVAACGVLQRRLLHQHLLLRPQPAHPELLNNSEDLRQIEFEWERIWFTDQPSHLTPTASTAASVDPQVRESPDKASTPALLIAAPLGCSRACPAPG